jgi:hypothetical protein
LQISPSVLLKAKLQISLSMVGEIANFALRFVKTETMINYHKTLHYYFYFYSKSNIYELATRFTPAGNSCTHNFNL